MDRERRPENKKREVKKFVDEQLPEERREVIAEVSRKRKEYFERKKQLGESLREMVTEAKMKGQEVATVRARLEQLEHDVEANTASIFSKVVNYIEVQRVRKEIDSVRGNLTNLEEEYQKLQSTISSLQENYELKDALKEAREQLKDFYKGKEKSWEEYEAERKASAISEVSKKYDVYIIHGIQPAFVPGQNSVLREGLPWDKKLEIALALQPELATSTISPGDSEKNMWARMGIILREGYVTDAYTRDAATKAKGLKRSTNPNLIQEKIKLGDKVEKSIRGRHPDAYNELVVQEPVPAAFYYSLDENPQVISPDRVDPKLIMPVLRETGLNLVVLKGGRTYEPVYDEETGALSAGREMTKEEVMGLKYEPTPEEKRRLLEKIFEDSPFRINNPELSNIDCRGDGMRTYMLLALKKDSEIILGQQLESTHDLFKRSQFKKQDAVFDLGSIHLAGKKYQYVRDGAGRVYETYSRRDSPELYKNQIDYMSNLEAGSIQLGVGTDTLPAAITDTESYVSGMRERIQHVKGEISKYEAAGDERMLPFVSEWLENLGFHLYGFAEQAGKLGDEESKLKAEALAQELKPLKEYAELVKKRIDEKGRIKISIEDLK